MPWSRLPRSGRPRLRSFVRSLAIFSRLPGIRLDLGRLSVPPPFGLHQRFACALALGLVLLEEFALTFALPPRLDGRGLDPCEVLLEHSPLGVALRLRPGVVDGSELCGDVSALFPHDPQLRMSALAAREPAREPERRL